MIVTCTSRARARLAVLAVVAGSSTFALGGLAREASARTTSGAQPCASVTLSDPACGQARPVPSLQPQATRRLWQHLASARQARTLRLAAAGTCRPLRAVFYTATDWTRLAMAQTSAADIAVTLASTARPARSRPATAPGRPRCR
jgi:hypothetical protein